jgi:xylulokinase
VWLGIDLGTSSVKAVLLEGDGTVRARVRVALPPARDERDVGDWVTATLASLGSLGSLKQRVTGVGLSGLTPTVVCVDGSGEAVRPALTWNDPRGEDEARELEAKFGSSEGLLGFDLPWSASYPPAKLAWLARHEPAVVAATRSVLQVKDYLGFKLTGNFISDAWSSKGLCNVLTGVPAREVLAACGWRSDVVPDIRPAWESRGIVTSAAARSFGLPERVPVAVGWSDALAGFLALGAFRQPSSVVILGTSNIIGVSLAEPTPQRHPGLLAVPAPVAPLYLLYGPTQNGGSAVAWIGSVLGLEPTEVLAKSLDARGTIPVFVPYLTGERTPIWNPDVRAAFANVGEDSGPAEFCAAVVRGLAASARHVLDATNAALGHSVGSFVALGGYGSGHQAWQRAFLEHLDRPITTVDDDVSVVGAAMLAAAAAGSPIDELPQVAATGPLYPTLGQDGGDWHRSYLRLSRLTIDEARSTRRQGLSRGNEDSPNLHGPSGEPARTTQDLT